LLQHGEDGEDEEDEEDDKDDEDDELLIDLALRTSRKCHVTIPRLQAEHLEYCLLKGDELLVNPASGAPRKDLVTIPRPPAEPYEVFSLEDDELLIDLKQNRSMTWDHILLHFLGRTYGSLQGHYSYSKRISSISKPKVHPQYTPEETERLVHLKEKMGYTWKQIILQFPGRTERGLKRKYFAMKNGNP